MFIFITLIRATFKLIKQRDEMFRLSTQHNANQEASDSNNGKLNYHYADLIEKEKLLLRNLFKNTEIEAGRKKKEKIGNSGKNKQEKIGKIGKKGVLFKKQEKQEKIGIVRPLDFFVFFKVNVFLRQKI